MPKDLDERHSGADEIAVALFDAWETNVQRGPLPEGLRPRDLTEAYAVQSRLFELLEVPLAGWKVAATDVATQERFGATEPFFGRLPAGGLQESPTVESGSFPGRVPIIECEVGLRLRRTLSADDGVFDVAAVRDSVEGACACFELPHIRFLEPAEAGLFSLVADCAGAGGAVIRTLLSLDELPSLKDVTVDLEVNGLPVAHGSGAAIMGDPLESLVWLANTVTRYGSVLEAGSLILTGAMTGLHVLERGDRVVGNFGPLGALEVSFT